MIKQIALGQSGGHGRRFSCQKQDKLAVPGSCKGIKLRGRAAFEIYRPVDKVTPPRTTEASRDSKKDASRRHMVHFIIRFRFNAVADKRQWSSAASAPHRRSRPNLCPHFCAAKVPSLQICRLRKALWYVGLSNSLRSSRISLQK